MHTCVHAYIVFYIFYYTSLPTRACSALELWHREGLRQEKSYHITHTSCSNRAQTFIHFSLSLRNIICIHFTVNSSPFMCHSSRSGVSAPTSITIADCPNIKKFATKETPIEWNHKICTYRGTKVLSKFYIFSTERRVETLCVFEIQKIDFAITIWLHASRIECLPTELAENAKTDAFKDEININ